MRQSIHQSMIQFGLTLQHDYLGARRLSPHRAEPVHSWSVQLVGAHPDAVLTDRYQASKNEYAAIQGLSTSVTEQYIIDMVQRMRDVEQSAADYEAWLDIKGVCFGVNTDDDSDTQAFWRSRYHRDVRVHQEFAEVMTGQDRASEFFSLIESR